MRYVVAVVCGALAVGGVWILTLPNKAACVASGRTVDPTERHCLSPDGFQQLQEHALFHSREVVLGAAIILGVAYAVRWLKRRRSGNATSTA